MPIVSPKMSVSLDPSVDGQWFVTGDIDGDGAVEIITARNHTDDATPPHVTSVCARKLDGSILWTWGDPAAGGWRLGYDVACQVHDWDGDGNAEVILATHSELVELDGATGTERRRLKIPIGASDCLTFADLTGRGRRGGRLLLGALFVAEFPEVDLVVHEVGRAVCPHDLVANARAVGLTPISRADPTRALR